MLVLALNLVKDRIAYVLGLLKRCSDAELCVAIAIVLLFS
jgi:hypothetical protein